MPCDLTPRRFVSCWWIVDKHNGDGNNTFVITFRLRPTSKQLKSKLKSGKNVGKKSKPALESDGEEGLSEDEIPHLKEYITGKHVNILVYLG